jgi:hypothetical protein
VLVASVAVIAVVLAVANVATSRALWRSQSFERSQKIAQTCLMWLVPGAFVIVRFAVRDSASGRLAGEPTSDPTTNREHGYYTDNPTGFHHGHGDGGHGP